MQLNAKLILSLVIVLMVTVVGAQAVQYYWTVDLVSEMNGHNLKLLRQSQDQQASNLSISVMRSIEGSLVRGEMEKFTRLLESLDNVRGLQEVSLFDAEGKVTHSSKPEFIGNRIQAGLQETVLSKPDKFIRETDGSTEIYEPHRVVGDCIRCHTSWKVNEIRGATLFRFSKEALVKAQEEAARALAKAESNSLWSALLSVAAVVIIFILGMLLTVSRFVSRPMGKLVEMLKQYDVDLTLEMPIQTRDEIGQVAGLLNRFVAKLNNVVGRAQKAALVVGEQVGGQASSIEQLSGTSEVIAATTKENSDNSRQAAELMNQINAKVNQAGASISTLSDSMADLTASSHRVAEIMKTIDDIAFQTNMLSLNAAVEAARAGDAGAGFAVVAGEVRALALRAAEAAQNTSQLIEGTISRIENSNDMVASVNRVFETVTEQITTASNLITDIAEASTKQAEGVEQINSTLRDVDQTTQVNAKQADGLSETMSTFQTTYTKTGKVKRFQSQGLLPGPDRGRPD